MKSKKIALITFCGLLLVALALFLADGDDASVEDENPRELASTSEYEAMDGCAKQDVLWSRIKATEYPKDKLPDFKNFGPVELFKLSQQAIAHKGHHHSDFTVKGWQKFLHARGVIAKVKIVPRSGNYTGIFQGAECALLRLSLTFKPGLLTGVAPGLALKVLRDRTNSANVSALVSLAGQGKDHNFFRHPMSNIVPIDYDFPKTIVHNIFAKVTRYPEELLVSDMAKTDARGRRAQPVVAPRQLFFVPDRGLSFSSDEHDVRDDIRKIPANTLVYRIYAAPEKRDTFDYRTYKKEDVPGFIDEAQHVADIVTTSEFVASSFGDGGIFFRHEIR